MIARQGSAPRTETGQAGGCHPPTQATDLRRSTHSNKDACCMTERNNARAQFKTLLHNADEAFWARDDAIARKMGWQIDRKRFGGRRYRDPRFDSLRAQAEVGDEEPTVSPHGSGGGQPPSRGFHQRRGAPAEPPPHTQGDRSDGPPGQALEVAHGSLSRSLHDR